MNACLGYLRKNKQQHVKCRVNGRCFIIFAGESVLYSEFSE